MEHDELFDFDIGFFDPTSWEEEERYNKEPYPDELWEEEFKQIEMEEV